MKPNKCIDCGAGSYGVRCLPCAKLIRRANRKLKCCPICGVKINRPSRRCRVHSRSDTPVVSDERWAAAVTQEAQALGIRPSRLMSSERTRVVVLGRCRAWRRLLDEGYTFCAVAKVSGFDHATIISGNRRIPAFEQWHVKRAKRLRRASADTSLPVLAPIREVLALREQIARHV